jgi:hypothetical protein
MTVTVKSSNSIFANLHRGLFLFFALLAYYLPFVWHKAAALTANGYDLAEWISIHPAVRGGNPPLLIPFLLRAALAGIAVLMGIQALQQTRWRWLYALVALALAVTLLPPLEYFVKAGDDPNYGQQFMIANGTLVVLVVLAFIGTRDRNTPTWVTVRNRILPILDLAIAAAIIVMVAVGVPLAMGVLRDAPIGLSTTLGGGAIFMFVELGLYILTAVIRRKQPLETYEY